MLFSKPPAVAGEPIADIILSNKNREELNGTVFELGKRIEEPDKAMNDEGMGKKLWKELVRFTGEKDKSKLRFRQTH